MKRILKIIKYIGDFLFPPTCHLCDIRLSSHDSFLCQSCISRLPRTLYHLSPMNPMEQRFAGLFPFEKATGHFFYSSKSDLSIIMQDLKYKRFRRLGRKLGAIVGKELFTTSFLSDIDVIVPVPIHFIKKAKRGYNQTEEIAIGISEETGIEISTDLIASRPHRTQTKLTLEERRKNTSNLFKLKQGGELSERLKNNPSLQILLVDDVCTTGSTLTSAAEALHKALPGIRLSILSIGATF